MKHIAYLNVMLIQKEDDCTQQRFKSNVWPNGLKTEDNENSEFIISIWV